ncbi:MAG TPA: RiPP maturation radical SAM C-methyltransferase [Patescibacteria group bacterium]|nr:RiPP maturation radical SAM C-methyltransferase [Patescibacteria group bacterium]
MLSAGINERSRQPSVLLISMPWTALNEPNLGLGLLKAVLTRDNIPCRVLHLNLFLLQYLEPRTYHGLANVFALNDFLFSGVLDPQVTNLQQRRLRDKVRELRDQNIVDLRKYGGFEGTVNTLLHLRQTLFPQWLRAWADEIAQSDATLIGFSCMFDQTIPSLALAYLINRRDAGKLLALGGYGARAPGAQMILRSNPWIHAVCAGEGEPVVGGLARASAGELPLSQVPGIFFRDRREICATVPPPQVNLNDNPNPDYDDFFADVERLSREHQVDVQPSCLPVENSRGCWWGAKNHCVFCGIHDEDLPYRERAPENTLRQIKELFEKHKMPAFRFADYIMPYGYFDTLLPQIIGMGSPFKIFAEIKANLDDEKFKKLQLAGVDEVQPGIESFSSPVLRYMNKGVTAMQNVYTLMLGLKYGVKVRYNLIYGFPDEDAGEYERMLAQLPRLLHCAPPMTCIPVQITRFSPMQTKPERFGIGCASASESYDMIFSRTYLRNSNFQLSDYCYYYQRPFENSFQLERIYADIGKLVMAWQRNAEEKKNWLYYEEKGSAGMVIHDRRREEKELVLDDLAAGLLKACAKPSLIPQLPANGETEAGPEVRDCIARLDELGLIFREGDWILSLVTAGKPQNRTAEQ